MGIRLQPGGCHHQRLSPGWQLTLPCRFDPLTLLPSLVTKVGEEVWPLGQEDGFLSLSSMMGLVQLYLGRRLWFKSDKMDHFINELLREENHSLSTSLTVFPSGHWAPRDSEVLPSPVSNRSSSVARRDHRAHCTGKGDRGTPSGVSKLGTGSRLEPPGPRLFSTRRVAFSSV